MSVTAQHFKTPEHLKTWKGYHPTKSDNGSWMPFSTSEKQVGCRINMVGENEHVLTIRSPIFSLVSLKCDMSIGSNVLSVNNVQNMELSIIFL